MRCIVLFAVLLAPGVTHAETPGLRIVDSRGLRFVEADLPKGTLTLALPGDIAAGDAVSGLLSIDAPDGADVTSASLHVGVQGFRASRARSTAAFRVPAGATDVPMEVVGEDGAILASGRVPVAPAVAPTVAPSVAAKEPRALPTRCPRHNLFVIEGRFDGDRRNTDVRIGDAWLTPWAESPRRIVLVGPEKLTGRHALDVGDDPWTAHGVVDVIGVEAEPRSKQAKAGEIVTITLRVSGVAALTPADAFIVDLETWIAGGAESTEALTITPSPPGDAVTLTRTFAVPSDGLFNCLARLRNEVSRPRMP